MESPNYCKLSHTGVRMLIELGKQLNGRNNGDLCATSRTLRARGWPSNETITRALLELEYFGFIVRTRQGGLNKCSLFAVTWRGIDECGGKLDISASAVPLRAWTVERPALRKPRKNKASTGAVTPTTNDDSYAGIEAMPELEIEP